MGFFRVLISIVKTSIKIIIFVKTMAFALLFFNKLFLEIRNRTGHNSINTGKKPIT